jgi:hypothetical protein
MKIKLSDGGKMVTLATDEELQAEWNNLTDVARAVTRR